jgi:hypothetical protein
MSVYKINPVAINQLREKYPQIELIYMVDGEESYRINETKATAILARYNKCEYLISFYRNDDGGRCYEVSEIGIIMDRIIGRYDTEVGAVMMILDNK